MHGIFNLMFPILPHNSSEVMVVEKDMLTFLQVLGQYVSLIFSDTFCTKILSPMWSHQVGVPSRDTDMRPENSVKIWNLLAI